MSIRADKDRLRHTDTAVLALSPAPTRANCVLAPEVMPMTASQSTASRIETVRLSDIDPNAMRDLDRYPFNAKKIEALRRSIQLVTGALGGRHRPRRRQSD